MESEHNVVLWWMCGDAMHSFYGPKSLKCINSVNRLSQVPFAWILG